MSHKRKFDNTSPIKAVYLVNTLYEYIDTVIPYLNEKHKEFNMNQNVQNCISVLMFNIYNLMSIVNTMDLDMSHIDDSFISAEQHLRMVEINCTSLVNREYLTKKQGLNLGGQIWNIRKELQNWKSYVNKHNK